MIFSRKSEDVIYCPHIWHDKETYICWINTAFNIFQTERRVTPIGVIVPIDLWHEIKSPNARGDAYLLKSEAMESNDSCRQKTVAMGSR